MELIEIKVYDSGIMQNFLVENNLKTRTILEQLKRAVDRNLALDYMDMLAHLEIKPHVVTVDIPAT